MSGAKWHAGPVSDLREDGLEVIDNAEASRYELLLNGTRVGLADYAVRDGRMLLPHTEVDPRHGGKGYGQRLVRYVLDDATARGLKVTPACSFVADFIRNHPDYADLVSARTV